MPVCPFCDSEEVGEIRAKETWSIREEQHIKEINAKKGIRIYYANLEEYKLLSDCGANYYCFACDHPFHGKREKKELDEDQIKEYTKALGVEKDIKHKIEKQGFFQQFLSIIKGY